jgi:N-methylhydantoinase A
VFSELGFEAWRSLEAENAELTRESLTRSADLRYRGQNFELRVEVPAGEIGPETLRQVESGFRTAHKALYSCALSSAPVDSST